MEFVNPVKDFIVENFLFGEQNNLQIDTSFIDNGIIDSTGILELVAFLEERFGVTVKDEDLLPENFNTLSGIARFLETKTIPR